MAHPHVLVNRAGGARDGDDWLPSTAFEDAPVALSVVRAADRRRVRVNQSFCDFVGYTVQELLALPLSAVAHPDDWAEDDAERQALIAGRIASVRRRKRYLHKSGKVLWGDYSARLLRDPDGRPTHFVSLVQDITAQTEAQRALAASEARFKSLCALSSDWFWEQDAEGRLLSLHGASGPNPDWLSLRLRQMVGSVHWTQDLLEPLGGTWGPALALLRERQPFRDLEFRVVGAPQDMVIAISGEPFYAPEGEFLGYRGTARDITERAQAQAMHREVQALAQVAMAVGRLGAWAYVPGEAHGRLTAEASEIFGVGLAPTYEEVLGAVVDEDRALARRTFDELVATGRSFDLQVRARAPGRPAAWLRVLGLAERDAQGAVTRMHGAVQDITGLKAVELQLKEAQRAMDSLMANLPGMAFRAQGLPPLPFYFASEGALALTGHTAAALVAGTPTYGELVHPDDLPLLRGAIAEGLAQRRPFQVTYRLLTPSGQKTVWEQGSGVFDPAGGLRCIEGFITDVSQLHEARRQLDELNRTLEHKVAERTEQLTAANAELEAIAYSIAHDLRAPMTTITSFAQLLQPTLGKLEGKPAHYLDRIAKNVHRMQELTTALLSLARLSGVTMQRRPVDLGALAQHAFAELQQAEPARPARLQLGGDLACEGDPALLAQLLSNLIGNAWKFSAGMPETRIEVGSALAQGRRVFHVRDHGVGFDMTYAQRLFTPFTRMHKIDEFEGTGIGLAVVRKIVHRHGGRVWASAEPGKGATIFFTLG